MQSVFGMHDDKQYNIFGYTLAPSDTVNTERNTRYKMSDEELQNISTFREKMTYSTRQRRRYLATDSMAPKACECNNARGVLNPQNQELHELSS